MSFTEKASYRQKCKVKWSWNAFRTLLKYIVINVDEFIVRASMDG